MKKYIVNVEEANKFSSFVVYAEDIVAAYIQATQKAKSSAKVTVVPAKKQVEKVC